MSEWDSVWTLLQNLKKSHHSIHFFWVTCNNSMLYQFNALLCFDKISAKFTFLQSIFFTFTCPHSSSLSVGVFIYCICTVLDSSCSIFLPLSLFIHSLIVFAFTKNIGAPRAAVMYMFFVLVDCPEQSKNETIVCM